MSTTNPTTTSNPTSAARPPPDNPPQTLFQTAQATLPKDKPLIFTNLLRFHPTAQYTSPPPSLLGTADPLPSCPGSTAYWHRYFPIYHRACDEALGPTSSSLQSVLYKGAPLMPLRFSAKGPPSDTNGKEEEGYWHAVVMTRVESWDVVEKIGLHEEYRTVAGWHRNAAVEDDALFVSCPVEGFEMVELR